MHVVLEKQFYVRYLKKNGKKSIEDMNEMFGVLLSSSTVTVPPVVAIISCS